MNRSILLHGHLEDAGLGGAEGLRGRDAGSPASPPGVPGLPWALPKTKRAFRIGGGCEEWSCGEEQEEVEEEEVGG